MTDSVAHARSETSFLLCGLWAALIAWAGEQVLLLQLRYVWHRPEAWEVEFVWLGLVAYVLTFVCVALALQVAARGRDARWIADGLFAGLTAFCVLLVFESIAIAASLLLAAGIAVRVSVVSRTSRITLDRVVRKSLPVLSLAAGLAFVVAVAWYPVKERAALSRLPPAPAGAPNILMLVLDTVRASELGLYGFGRPTTPRIEALAREGVRFDRAMSTAPWTLASHLSMFSGIFPHAMATEIEANPREAIDRARPLLARVLADRGYVTGAFSANLPYITHEWGLDRGFVHFEDFPMTWGAFLVSTAAGRAIAETPALRRWLHKHEAPLRKPAGAISARLLRWTTQHGDRPFFAFANFFDAHLSRFPPEPFRSRFARTSRPMRFMYRPMLTRPAANPPKDPREYEAHRDLYDGTIAWLDHEVGSLLQEMETRGLLTNTIVVLTADHGEMFGERGRLGHGYLLFQPLIHVPLVISYPGHIAGGAVVAEPVTLADLPATILHLAGVDRGGIPGTSLARFWTSEALGPSSPIVAEDPRWRPSTGEGRSQSIVEGRYQYIRHFCCVGPGERGPKRPRPDELYDLDADPSQLQNLAGDPTWAAVRDRLSAALDAAAAGDR